MNIMRTFAIIYFAIIVNALSGCANQDLANSPPKTSANANARIEIQKSILLSAYLDLDHPDFFFQAEDGTRFRDELETFKALEAVYTDIKERITENETPSLEDIKLFLFFTAYANDKNSGAFSEYLNSDLTPIFKQHSQLLLEALKQLPFLTKQACYHLDRYFGFEGKHYEQKKIFLGEFETKIQRGLGDNQGKECLAAFK